MATKAGSEKQKPSREIPSAAVLTTTGCWLCDCVRCVAVAAREKIPEELTISCAMAPLEKPPSRQLLKEDLYRPKQGAFPDSRKCDDAREDVEQTLESRRPSYSSADASVGRAIATAQNAIALAAPNLKLELKLN